MTYRFGRTGKKRNAAMQQGLAAYTFAGAPMQFRCPEGTHMGSYEDECIPDDPKSPLDDTIVVRPPKKEEKSSKKTRRKRRK